MKVWVSPCPRTTPHGDDDDEMMMLLMMQPRSQIPSYPSRPLFCLFVYMFHAPRCRKAGRRANEISLSAFFARRLAQVPRQLPGPVTRQAKHPSHAHKNCKASQENIIVPLQNCITVYHDSETPSKWTGSYVQKVWPLLESIFTLTLNSFSWFSGMEGEDAGFKTDVSKIWKMI